MSTKLTGYVWDGCAASGMKLSSVAIMARLADFSNDEGVCWPSIETIARQIGAGMSTVRTAIARLEAEGWLTRKARRQGTRFGPGQAIVTPAVIKGELLATYRQLERAGIVENYELFKQYLVVERDASDPNRLNTLFPPDYVNQLRVFAVVNQFRLQYSEESA
ncbi:GntR family transcriptional regulator [Escherichia coli]|nr:GntR family transcriptional regulator [Escherichia coli]